MALFTSVYVNKIDKKGRVSVPASFRAALAAMSFAGIYAYRTFAARPMIEASGADRMERFADELERIDEDSDRAAYLRVVLADARPLPWDAEGRVVLPLDLTAFAGLGEEVAFVGQGKIFLICEPLAVRHEIEAILARPRPKASIVGMR